jgi:hypothetical protein
VTSIEEFSSIDTVPFSIRCLEGNVMHTSAEILDFIKELRLARFFVLVTLADCAPCMDLREDVVAGALVGLDVLMLTTQTDLSSDNGQAIST